MNRYQSGIQFEQTNWEFIENLKSIPFAELNKETVERFTSLYQDPLYSFLRFSGHSREDSEDLVQDLFLELVETDLLKGATQEGGKLRTYLIGVLKRIIVRKRRKDNAQKRGGGLVHIDIEDTNPEHASDQSPDREFDQAWARRILDDVTCRLFADQPQLSILEVKILTEMLNWNAKNLSYKEAASQLNISIPALKSRVFRLRVTFKQLLYEQIASTLTDPTLENIEQEIKTLLNSWD